MQEAKEQLLDLVNAIQGSGSFAVSGVKKFTLPGLHIEGLGELAFPINDLQAKAIIQLAKQAPFGKGSQTITDTSVRNSWEVDASLLSFHNNKWESFLKKTIKKVKKGLGIEKREVTASLYKMLLYEKGGFFKTHKDSEKEPGMFGTLVIGLPSNHTGGELAIRFDGREEVFGFSEAASNFQMPFTAFFADCDHELLPVKSGYRVTLAYNLLLPEGSEGIGGNSFSGQAAHIVPLLQSMQHGFEGKPLAILLGHQYTPTNFSLDSLKNHDRPRAEALMAAAEQADYFAGLGLVTHYLMGQLEEPAYRYRGRRRRRRYYDYDEYSDPEGGSMGEIYETYTKIEHWSGEGASTMGTVQLDEEDILANIELGEDDPIAQEAEGYTGNAGMTMEYWYHYGAVVIWPKNQHGNLLSAKPPHVRIEWLTYYLDHWGEPSANAPQYARQLVKGFSPEEFKESYNMPDCTPFAQMLVRLEDGQLLKKHGLPVLEKVFHKIEAPAWVALLEQFKPALFDVVFSTAIHSGDKEVFDHLLATLIALSQQGKTQLAFVKSQLQPLSEGIEKTKLHQLKSGYYYSPVSTADSVKAITQKLLLLAQLPKGDQGWADEMTDSLTRPLPRDYANEVLIAVLLGKQFPQTLLSDSLQEVCTNDLQKRTAKQPTPPPDWKRKVPSTDNRYEGAVWKLLRPFLESPTEQVFNYVKSEAYRQQMASAINSVTIDLKMETIRKGRPYTLRLTKTQAAYELKLANWKEDLKLLSQMENLKP